MTSSLAALVCATAMFGVCADAQARGDSRTKASEQPPKAQKAKSADEQREARGPLVVVVNLREQELKVYDGDTQIARSAVSSGRSGYDTPTGVFSILQKNRVHFSNLYDDAPMPNMQRLTWSGIALHAGSLPGYPASHGCIRLPHSFSKQLFGMTRMGTRVIVTRDRVAPLEIDHERLAMLSLRRAAAVTSDAAGQPARVAGEMPMIMRLGAEVSSPEDGAAAALQPVTVATTGQTSVPPALPSLVREAAERAERAVTGLEAAREARAKAETAARAAVVAQREAREAILEARAEAQRRDRAVDAIDKAIETTNEKLQALLARADRMNEPAQEKAAEIETDLEADLERLATDRAAARDAAATAAQTVTRLTEGLSSVEEARVAATGEFSAAAAAERLAEEELRTARREVERRKKPASIFVSRKTGRLAVRQGNEPLLDLPVEISGTAPIGTHVFTALESEDGEATVRWSVVSIGEKRAAAPVLKSSRDRRSADAQPVLIQATSSPSEALSRLGIPAETLAQLAEVVKPGSSLVISDNGLSSETGRHTDFIVSTF